MRAVAILAIAACARAKVPPATGSGSGSSVDLRALVAAVGGQGSASFDDAMKQLVALRDAATPADRPLLDHGVTALEAMHGALADEQRLPHAVELYLAWMRELYDHSKSDVATLRMLASSMDMLAIQIENMGIDKQLPPAPIHADALARMRDIAQRFPGDARTFRMLGGALERANDVVGAMHAFATCARLDAKQDCADVLARMKKEYVLPYCEGADIRADLAWQEHGAAAPRFSAKDVRIVEARFGRDDAIYPSIVLRDDVLPAYSAWIDELQNRNAFFVLAVGGKTLATSENARYATPIRNASFMPGAATLDDLCTKTQTRALPADL